MGINPIEYRPWSGKRAGYISRMLPIPIKVLQYNWRSGWIKGIVIVGTFLIFFPLFVSTLFTPHEELTARMMLGVDRDFWVDDEDQIRESVETDTINVTIVNDTTVELQGEVLLEGNLTIFGSLTVLGVLDFRGNISGEGSLSAWGDWSGEGGFTAEGKAEGNLSLEGELTIAGFFYLAGSVQGAARIECRGEAPCLIFGFGNVSGNVTIEEAAYDPVSQEFVTGFIGHGLFPIITLILAALVCSDLVSDDFRSNSFVLYFSRPVRPRDYLLGKFVGAFFVMSLFCVLPVIAVSTGIIATQSGDSWENYRDSLRVAITATIATSLIAAILIPYGMLMSSFTKSKSYATVGTFMSFFALIIIGEGFGGAFDPNWRFLNWFTLTRYLIWQLFGRSVPAELDPNIAFVIIVAFILIPLLLLYARVRLKGVGK